MLKKPLILLALWGVSLSLVGQTTLVSNQAGLAQKKSQYRKALGCLGDQVYTAYSSNADISQGFVVERYSADMIFQADRKIESQGKQRILRLVLGDSCLYWVSVVRLKRQVYKLWYHRLSLDLSGSVFSKELLTLTGVELDINAWETSVSNSRKSMAVFAFGVQSIPSQDGHRLTVVQSMDVGQFGDIIDQFQANLPVDFGVDEVVWRSVELDDSGNSVMIYEDQQSGGTLFNSKRELSHFHLIQRFHQKTNQQRLSISQEYLENAIPLNSQYDKKDGFWEQQRIIQEAAVSLDPNTGAFTILGFWSEYKQSGLSGHFIGYLHPSDSVLLKDTSKHTWILKSTVWNDFHCRQLAGLLAAKKSGKPESYFIRELVSLSHGGWLILAEQFYETRQMETYYVNGIPQTSSKLFYHYGDIAAMYVGVDGKVDTTVMVRKTQVGTASNAYMYGFTHYICEGSLNLVYNDDEGEMNHVMHVKIDNTFALEKQWLFRSENIPGSVVPYEGLHSDYCTLTVPIYRDKQWHWLQIFSND